MTPDDPDWPPPGMSANVLRLKLMRAEKVIEAVNAALDEWEPKSTRDPMARIYRAMQEYNDHG